MEDTKFSNSENPGKEVNMPLPGFTEILIKTIDSELKRLRRKKNLKMGEREVADMTIGDFIDSYTLLKEGEATYLKPSTEHYLKKIGEKCGRQASRTWKKKTKTNSNQNPIK